MTREYPTWRDRFPDAATCVRCLEERDVMRLDRLLWCDECRFLARNRAAWWGWIVGLAFGACVAGYIWLILRPTDLVISGWVATVVASVWIGSKVGREIVYGAMRFRNARAVEAVPPVLPPVDGD
ncbi:MAG: hypothetical protein OEZ65_10870 [Gemmatimonadota bacterium]|nr:hypothetical protein [Gemmatimonadota bacterium]